MGHDTTYAHTRHAHTRIAPMVKARGASRRVLPALVAGALAALLAGCATPPQKTGTRGVGRPPPEQAAVEYSQSRRGPLITPENDPFAVD